jgi:hypothetical protein
VRNANAEANLVPPPTPRFRQGSDSVTHFESHQHRLERGVLYGHWIIEDHNPPSPAYRSSVPLYLMMISPIAV